MGNLSEKKYYINDSVDILHNLRTHFKKLNWQIIEIL